MIKEKLFSGFVIFAIILLITISTSGIIAGDVDRIGTASGVQVLVPTGPRDLATLGSNLAYTSGIHALHWNPAGLSRMENTGEGQFSTITIFNDININYLAAGFNIGSIGQLAFSIKAFDFGDIPITTVEDMDGKSGATFSPTFVTTVLTYSNQLTDNIRIGLSTKFIYESIPSANASAVAFDIGLQYDGVAGIAPLSFGVVLKNIGTDMRYEGSGLMDEYTDPQTGRQDFLKRDASSNDLPASYDISVGYKMDLREQHSMIISTAFANNNFGYDDLKLGIEYNYNNFIFLRGGYNFGVDKPSDEQMYDFALGAGIQLGIGEMDLAIDYAFRNSQYFDANNMFGLTIGF